MEEQPSPEEDKSPELQLLTPVDVVKESPYPTKDMHPEDTPSPPEDLPPEETTSLPEETSSPPEKIISPPEPIPPPPSINTLPISSHHDYDTLYPEQEGPRVEQESGIEDEEFVDAEEELSKSHTYSPVEEEKAGLDELLEPAKTEEHPIPIVLDIPADPATTSPTSTLVDKAAGEATLKLIGDYDDIDKTLNQEKSPEPSKSMFDKIREFFDEPKEPDQDNYAPISITTSKCSVCQGLHKSGSSGSTPHDHEFSIYGPLTVDGSPDSNGSFCPICQTRAEHDQAVKSNTHG
ncbi:zonadhesin-like [Bolinopsis microptera]|uniref:zonadhesin-like n=1 Tax=Bolinopsis microptera TaxID=2820187 RepID=UPI0030799859